MAQDPLPVMLSLLQTVVTGDSETDRDLRLLCDVGWSSTSVGRMCLWPQDLLTLVYLAMLSPQPQLFLLGTEHILLYNTAYSRLLRSHHPAYFARPIASLERLQPQAEAIRQVMQAATESRRPATVFDKSFFFDNGAHDEEIFLSATMILLPPHLQGYQATTEDTTLRVVASRRTESLATLNYHCSSAKDIPSLLQSVLRSFSQRDAEFPFAVVFGVEDQPAKESLPDSLRSDECVVVLRLAGSTGDFDCTLPETLDLTSSEANLTQCMRKAITSRVPLKISAEDDPMLANWCQASGARGYGDFCKEAIVFPASCTLFHGVKALVVVGIAPRRPFDDVYQAWIREVQKCIGDQAFAIECVEAREIAKRKAAERAQKEAEITSRELDFRRKEAIIAKGKIESVLGMAETFDVGFFEYLPTGELMHGNNAFYELSGYPRDPALNKQLTFLDYCVEEDAEMVLSKWNWLMTGKPVTFEMRWKNDTPTGQWVQAACTPVFDDAGNIVSISGCTTDISAQKRVQEEAVKQAETLEQVRISQARLLQFTDNAPMGIVIRDSSGKNLYINNSWFKLTGHPNNPSSEVDVISACYSDDVHSIKTKENEAIQQRKTVEVRARLKKEWSNTDGSFQGQAWVSIICFPEFSEDGMLNRIVTTWTDVSHSQLSELVQRRRLEEAVEAKRRTETFIDITSHEIRNPLGATVHCADLLQESLAEMEKLISMLTKGNDDDTGRQSTIGRLKNLLISSTDAVETIMSCSMHQKRITDDILSLSKLDSNLLQVSLSAVRVTEVLDNVSNNFAVQATRAGVVLHTRLDESLRDHSIDWVMIDPGRISQVLVNLVTNAIKFTETCEGERTVCISLGASKGRPTDLSVAFATTRNPEDVVQMKPVIDATFYLWFSVDDTGCGMNEEEQNRMFARFSQASPRTYNQYGGSGLGLFISKRLVELQGGEIGLASRAGSGSTFAFYIPAQAVKSPEIYTNSGLAIRARVRASPPTTTRESTNVACVDEPQLRHTVLVVEDNLVNQKVLQKHLIKYGYKVQTANHGQEALDYIATTAAWRQENEVSAIQNVHMVLMDIEMPIMDGLACSKRIREMQASGGIVRHIPIIAVSANARPEQMKQALDAGMDGFITKPFRMPELIPMMTRLIEAASD